VPIFYTVVLPVVVVPDGSLWIVDYDGNGSISNPPLQTNACELFVCREIKVTKEWFPHQFTLSHIHFFTISGFSSFLSSMAVNDFIWNRLFTTKALEVC